MTSQDIHETARSELAALEVRSEGKDPTEAIVEYFRDTTVDLEIKACVAAHLLIVLPDTSDTPDHIDFA